MFLSIFSNKKVLQKNSKRLIKEHSKSANQEKISDCLPMTIKIPFYVGKNEYVLKMSKALEKNLKQDLLGAYVHGSLATEEQLKYSDFDALVILKDEVFESKERIYKVAKRLNNLQGIMLKFDPLQHHGWFVLKESMLKNYPLEYFPPVLFEYSKSMLKGQGESITLYADRATVDFNSPFYKLANSLIIKLNNFKKTKNSFVLKSLLSEFMLLPSLYIQAQKGEGVFKKHSYDIARRDFKEQDWGIMDEVSEIRTDWNYDINGLQRLFLTANSYAIRKVARKFAPSISPIIADKLNDSMYQKMLYLVELMKEKLEVRHEL